MDAKKIKFLIAGSVLVIAMVSLFALSLNQPGAAYYISVSEFASQGPTHGANFRINGKVVPGTVERPPGGTDLVFRMTDGTSTLPVAYHGIVPDTFTDECDVVVEGEMGPDGKFEAHTLLAKCPSKYDAAEGADETAAGGVPSEAISG